MALEIWEITRARQSWRYGIPSANWPAPVTDAWSIFEMLNESFREFWLMENIAMPIRRVSTLPDDASYEARWDLLASLEGDVVPFTFAEQAERLRRLDEED